MECEISDASLLLRIGISLSDLLIFQAELYDFGEKETRRARNEISHIAAVKHISSLSLSYLSWSLSIRV